MSDENKQADFIRTPREQTALVKCMEECGELIQAAAKASIFGIESYHIHTGKPNREDLEDEIADVYAILGILEAKYRLDHDRIIHRMGAKQKLHIRLGILTNEESLEFVTKTVREMKDD